MPTHHDDNAEEALRHAQRSLYCTITGWSGATLLVGAGGIWLVANRGMNLLPPSLILTGLVVVGGLFWTREAAQRHRDAMENTVR